ncbi:hypothetical protein GLYMA_01G216700v4 [Glycine max]|nr:hypothetical protein GLYMA_01G216700v4 [Glycine max]KAH1164254.1 hypothetical protein GYH30_002341 [Glycine max]
MGQLRSFHLLFSFIFSLPFYNFEVSHDNERLVHPLLRDWCAKLLSCN